MNTDRVAFPGLKVRPSFLKVKIPPPPPPTNVHSAAEFKRSAQRLAAANPASWAGLLGAIRYLLEFKRAAIAPNVRWHIVESDFGNAW